MAIGPFQISIPLCYIHHKFCFLAVRWIAAGEGAATHSTLMPLQIFHKTIDPVSIGDTLKRYNVKEYGSGKDWAW